MQRATLLSQPLRSVRTNGAAAPRRFASSAPSSANEAAQAGKEKASAAAQAGKEKANAAAESAKKYASQASEQGSKIVSQLGDRANSLLGSYAAPLRYNLSVLREVGKQVYIKEQLAPPTNVQTLRSAYEEIYTKASDASWWRSTIESGAWKKVAIYAVEAYGIFTIGEMIGRRHVVGYKVE